MRLANDDELDECSSSAMINGERMDLPAGKFIRKQDTNSMLIELSPALLHELAVTR